MLPVSLSEELLLPYWNQAIDMVASGYASADAVDTAMRHGCGYPLGPIAQVQEFGLARALICLEQLHERTSDPRHRPSPLLVSAVASGAQVLVDADRSTTSAGSRASLGSLRVVVVGNGTMGTGIAQVLAGAGHWVHCLGRSKQSVDKAAAALRAAVDRQVGRGRMTSRDAESLLAGCTFTTDRSCLAEADLVVEALAEDLEIKSALFAELGDVCRQDTVLATTTSALSISALASLVPTPGRVIGMHFFNPAPVMKLVEVVTLPATAAATVDLVEAVCAQSGKVAVRCEDRAGFVANALLFPYLNDAIRIVDQGRCSVDELDALMKGGGMPMGPFALLDVVGLDVSLAIQRVLHEEFGHASLEPAASLVAKVARGDLGRKSGAGFHAVMAPA